jgi:hypothetical protein
VDASASAPKSHAFPVDFHGPSLWSFVSARTLRRWAIGPRIGTAWLTLAVAVAILVVLAILA